MPLGTSHRGHGEGSIQERNGKFRATIMIDGKRHSHTTTTRTAARAWLRNTRAAADKGDLPPSAGSLTVAEHLDRWLEITSSTLKPKSIVTYRCMIALHLKPEIGQHKLAALRSDHVQTLITTLRLTLAPKSIALILGILHGALASAVTWKLLAHNVTADTTRPRIFKKEMKTWTLPQARTFLASVDGKRAEPLYRLALASGMRQGELLGLRWDDLDLENGDVSVRRAIQHIAGQGVVVGEPKTGHARTIALTGAVIASLRAWQVRQAEERSRAGKRWTEAGYVFTSTVGTPLDARRVREDFIAASLASGVPRIRFHDLRHTCATILLTQRVHPKVVQEMLGHSNIAMTMEIYSHVLPHIQTDAARILDRALAGAVEMDFTPVLHPTSEERGNGRPTQQNGKAR